MAGSFQRLVRLQGGHEWGLANHSHLYRIWILQLLYQGDSRVLVLVSKLEKPARLIEMHYFLPKTGKSNP